MRRSLALLCMLLLAAPAGSFASVSDDQVTSQKIKEADGTSGQNTNSGSGVKTNHIQNAAVTNAKIADGAVGTTKLLNGSVTASKLGVKGNPNFTPHGKRKFTPPMVMTWAPRCG